MTHTELTAAISSNLREINGLNTQVRNINAGLVTNPAKGWDHRLVLIEVATMRIFNLMFWIGHWNDALAKVGA